MSLPSFRPDGWLPVGHHAATWEEIIERFGGEPQSRRERLTRALLMLREELRGLNVEGLMILDGSYISSKNEPGDFDVLIIAPEDIQVRKDREPSLADVLYAERAEKERGYSLLYIPDNSPLKDVLSGVWDVAKDGTPKGVVEVPI